MTQHTNIPTTERLISDIPADLARRAHYGTSHTPEDRGDQERAGYAAQLVADWNDLGKLANTDEKQAILAAEFGRYRLGYATKYRSLLEAKGRCYSTMITGRSGFNTRRAQKANRTADNRSDELTEYRERALRAIRRKLQPEKAPIMQGDADAAVRLRAKISKMEISQALMKDINGVIRKHKKAGKEAQLVAVIALGSSESQAYKLLEPDFAGRIGFPAYALTNNNAEIRRLKGRLVVVERNQAAESVEIEGDNGIRFEDCPADNRVRLFFPGKPELEVRKDLKSHGFRWAPSLGAWSAYRKQWTVDFAKRIAGVAS